MKMLADSIPLRTCFLVGHLLAVSLHSRGRETEKEREGEKVGGREGGRERGRERKLSGLFL